MHVSDDQPCCILLVCPEAQLAFGQFMEAWPARATRYRNRDWKDASGYFVGKGRYKSSIIDSEILPG